MQLSFFFVFMQTQASLVWHPHKKKEHPLGIPFLFDGCGERGIRTPGASQHAGFQDRCNRPLYHLSELSNERLLVLKRCKGKEFP